MKNPEKVGKDRALLKIQMQLSNASVLFVGKHSKESPDPDIVQTTV